MFNNDYVPILHNWTELFDDLWYDLPKIINCVLWYYKALSFLNERSYNCHGRDAKSDKVIST